jgi:hypothetical protein
VFTPVLAKHSKSFSLIDCISVGVDRMQRNSEAMREKVEVWQRSELTDVTAKVVIYEAFVEGKLEAPKHLARTVHDLYFEPKYEEFRPRTIWSLSNAFTSAFKELDPIPSFLRTPVQAPKANAYCERLMGTIGRECLDYVIALSEKHLRTIMREWVTHYNQGRPHASLGPGVPDSGNRPQPRPRIDGHELPADCRIRARDVLGGLHHEYWLEEIAA